MKVLVGCAVFAGAMGLASAALAQSFNVSAEIVPGCAVRGTQQTTALAMGTIDFGVMPATYTGAVQASAPTTVAGGVELECTAGLTLTLTIDAGQHASGGVRRMATAGGAAHVPYALYADAAHQTAVPLAGGVAVSVPPGGVIDLPIHAVAQLPGSAQAPGVYSDTVAVTLSW